MVASVSLVMLAVAFGALWIVAVGLKAIAADLGGARSGPSLASSLAWFGSSFGGLMMGPLAERYGVRKTVIFGAVSICIGLWISTFGELWQLYLGHGIFVGLLGTAGLNAPLYVYVSHWFDRRRGSALALLSSGLYLAGTVWPPIFERAIANFGWRTTMVAYGLFAAAVIVPLALIFLKNPPETPHAAGAAGAAGETPRVFGWPPNVVFALLAAAAFLCCVTMSMPQNHLVALCTDLGYSAQSGAAMLSLLLGLGVLGRQIWGAISDRIGGLSTLLISSLLQGPRHDRLRRDAGRMAASTASPPRSASASARSFRPMCSPCANISRRARRAGACRWCCCSAARAWRPAPGSPARSTTISASTRRPLPPALRSTSRTSSSSRRWCCGGASTP